MVGAVNSMSRVSRHTRRWGPEIALSVLLVTGCGLRARNHPCWAYVSHHYQGAIPKDVMRMLSHDPGATRQVGRMRAPTGWYWRRSTPATADVNDIRTVAGGHELARCPGVPIDSGR